MSLIEESKPCAFCIIPSIKERMIAENELACAFPTNIPIVPGHTLVPKRCVPTFEELTPQERIAIFDLSARIRLACINVYKAEGFNYSVNEGTIAGQTVPHFHLHILPRKEGDTGITQYEPRQFLYRPGSRETSSDVELIAVAMEIKDALV